MILKKHFAVLLLSFTCYTAWSQTPAPFHFTGYGRALIANNKYNEESNFVKDDTLSEKKSLIGNFVFDLGVNVVPSETFKVSTILRVENQFGGFFSTGSDLVFRQVQVQGILARKVSYQLGDIDLGMTKYTLYNFDEVTRSPFEADAFKIKRDIVSYDNFNFGNKWRVQGAEAGTAVEFEKAIEEIKFNAFGARIKPSDFLMTPDRIMYGGSVKIRQSRFFEAGGNYIAISDIAGTVQDTAIHYFGSVLTGDYKAEYTTRSLILSLSGEVGTSSFDMNKSNEGKRLKTNDGFFDVALGLKHKYVPVKVSASYRVVGPEFYSPGAQTRRIYDFANPGLLPEGTAGATTTTMREQNIHDRLSDLNLYNRTITTNLMAFAPWYNNALPYGPATPNRKGIEANLNYGNPDSLIYADVKVHALSEVIGVGIKDKRKFMILEGGATLNLSKLIGFKKLLALSGGMRYEKTSGSEAARVDLTSTIIDGSLTIETLKRLDLIGGIKMFRSEGSENFPVRNDFNEVYTYLLYDDVRINDQVVTAGIRYRFSNYIFFTANALFTQTSYPAASNFDYGIRQLFFGYIMKF